MLLLYSCNENRQLDDWPWLLSRLAGEGKGERAGTDSCVVVVVVDLGMIEGKQA